MSEFIQLRIIEEITGRELGNLLVDISGIESVQDYDHRLHPGSLITMKPVINGFLGDDDRIYKYQTTHHVAESVNQVAELIASAHEADKSTVSGG